MALTSSIRNTSSKSYVHLLFGIRLDLFLFSPHILSPFMPSDVLGFCVAHSSIRSTNVPSKQCRCSAESFFVSFQFFVNVDVSLSFHFWHQISCIHFVFRVPSATECVPGSRAAFTNCQNIHR